MRHEKIKELLLSLTEKERREAFVQQQINFGIPFQIRGMRRAPSRNWSQGELAQRLGKPQSVVSRLESPGYGNFTLQTLREIASVFDVALLVSFVSFDELVGRFSTLGVSSVEISSYAESVDKALNYGGSAIISDIAPNVPNSISSIQDATCVDNGNFYLLNANAYESHHSGIIGHA